MGISLAPLLVLLSSRTSLVAQMVSVCLQCGSPGFNPDVGKILWRRQWQPTPVLLPGKSHGWRILVGYSPRGCKELDIPEQLNFSSFISLQILESWKTIFIFSLCSCLRWSHPALCFKCQTKTLMSPLPYCLFSMSHKLSRKYTYACVPVCVLSHFSHVRLFANLWIVACQAPLSLGFSRQEYWSGLPFPPPGDLPAPGIKPL